jgi:hypothetical protein
LITGCLHKVEFVRRYPDHRVEDDGLSGHEVPDFEMLSYKYPALG